MRTTILTLLAATVSTAFGGTVSFSCTPASLTNSFTLNSAVYFLQANGTGSFACSDAALGAVTLNSVSVSIQVDYAMSDGASTGPATDSAGFQFSNSSATWANASAGGSPSVQNLGSTLTVYAIGNLSSTAMSIHDNGTGGLTGTAFQPPLTDAMNSPLQGTFAINVSAFVDAGTFAKGLSDAEVTVTYDYNAVPEPATAGLAAIGLILAGIAGRKRFVR